MAEQSSVDAVAIQPAKGATDMEVDSGDAETPWAISDGQNPLSDGQNPLSVQVTFNGDGITHGEHCVIISPDKSR